MSQTATVVALDASVIFRTKPDKRLKLYGGIGISIGGKFNVTTSITERGSEGISTTTSRDDYEFESEMERDDPIVETYDNKGSIYSALYLPMGYTFRLGNKREFWKRLHLMGEIRPQLSIAGIPEIRTEVTTAITTVGGFRYLLSGY